MKTSMQAGNPLKTLPEINSSKNIQKNESSDGKDAPAFKDVLKKEINNSESAKKSGAQENKQPTKTSADNDQSTTNLGNINKSDRTAEKDNPSNKTSLDATKLEISRLEATSFQAEETQGEDVNLSDPAQLLAWMSQLPPVTAAAHKQSATTPPAEEDSETEGALLTKNSFVSSASGKPQDEANETALTPALNDKDPKKPIDLGAIASQLQSAAKKEPMAEKATFKLPEAQPEAAISNTPQSIEVKTLSAAPAPKQEFHIQQHVNSPNWGNELGSKIVFMTSQQQQSATLTLNPPELGPLQVVINIENEQASASFTAHQPEVRQAIEDALPRLKEMMQEAGIQLGHTSVGSERQQDKNAFVRPENINKANPTGESEELIIEKTVRITQKSGLVDTFA